MHLSINSSRYAFFDKIFLRLSTDEISAYPTKRIFSRKTSNKHIVFLKYFHTKKGQRPVYFSLN